VNTKSRIGLITTLFGIVILVRDQSQLGFILGLIVICVGSFVFGTGDD